MFAAWSIKPQLWWKIGWKNDSASANKTNYLEFHGPRPAACCIVNESRGLSSFFLWHWALSRDPRLFQPITYFCFSTVLTWYHVSQDRSLYTWEWRWIRVDVLRFDTEVRLLCSLQADTLTKWEIRGAERHMRGRCVLVHFHIGLKRQKGQLVHSSTFHLKSPDGLFLLQNWCATV